MLVKALRVGLGQIIVLGDALTRPRPQQRSAQGQAAVNAEAAQLSLYQSTPARSASRRGAPFTN